MRNRFPISIKILLLFTLLGGVVYPAIIYLVGQQFFPFGANGSLVTVKKRIVGSVLIAQRFRRPEYFHSRPSVIAYDARRSGGSNFTMLDKAFYEKALKEIAAVRRINGITARIKLPADMVFSSASGLDPHISVHNAMLQFYRVYKARKLSKAQLKKLIYEAIDEDFVGVWGKRGVNVLKLNLALDRAERG